MSDLRNQYLITSGELRARLGEPGLAVIDARWDLGDSDGGRNAYRAGHIPGARYVSWLDDISDPADAVAGQLAGPAGFARAMSAAGVGDTSDVVAYDDSTIFLLWQGKVPTVIDATKLVVGDRIVVRIRADKGASLATVLATPANHIGDREPAAK